MNCSAERQVRLLQLAEQYDFIILEDDYDFDFHYDGSPILPLASTDAGHQVKNHGARNRSWAAPARYQFRENTRRPADESQPA